MKSSEIVLWIVFVIFLISLILLIILLIKKIIQAKQIPEGYASINSPYIEPEIINNVISQNECNDIISYARNKLFDSEILSGKNDKIRNSKQCWIPKTEPLAKNIIQNLAQKYKIPFDNAEDLQVVRYLPGQYFNEHHDACCDDNDYCINFTKHHGQRILTVLIYLNNDFTEGETYFKNLNLKLKPKVGDGITFYPLAKGSKKCHPKALHAGLPVTSGEKWVCNVWFRENKWP